MGVLFLGMYDVLKVVVEMADDFLQSSDEPFEFEKKDLLERVVINGGTLAANLSRLVSIGIVNKEVYFHHGKSVKYSITTENLAIARGLFKELEGVKNGR